MAASRSRAADGLAVVGRLLVYFPDQNLADGAAELESDGFFDAHNTPPWDTWVGLFRDEVADRSARDQLICWVPPDLIATVDRGIAVNPEVCIDWVTGTNCLLGRSNVRDLAG